MSNLKIVGISDYKVAGEPDVLITYALGSCIGTCLYDGLLRMAGLSHILLPESNICPGDPNPMKYADTAIEALIKTMERAGASRARLTAKIAGGAKMFNCDGVSIGERNIEAIKYELARLNIRLIAEDTGRDYGRTVEFNPKDGSVTIKSVLHGNKSI
jgi:chemotaxis protein CheD